MSLPPYSSNSRASFSSPASLFARGIVRRLSHSAVRSPTKHKVRSQHRRKRRRKPIVDISIELGIHFLRELGRVDARAPLIDHHAPRSTQLLLESALGGTREEQDEPLPSSPVKAVSATRHQTFCS